MRIVSAETRMKMSLHHADFSGSKNPFFGHHSYTKDGKKCTKCNLLLPLASFRMDNKDHCLRSWCKKCEHQYDQDRKHIRGLKIPMEKAKNSAAYLGIYVAETVLSKCFDNVERMPRNNPGYDFVCGKGFKVDVKSSCIHRSRKSGPHWLFDTDYNKIADYFLCLAFDNRESLTPMHVWVLPGEIGATRSNVYIANSRLEKWAKYERSLDKISACCNAMKNGRGGA